MSGLQEVDILFDTIGVCFLTVFRYSVYLITMYILVLI